MREQPMIKRKKGKKNKIAVFVLYMTEKTENVVNVADLRTEPLSFCLSLK